mgnify:CR=1 FL=1
MLRISAQTELAVIGVVIDDLAVLDGLDNGVVLHGIAVAVELQVAGDQTGNFQSHQSLLDILALGGVGSLDGLDGSDVSIVAAGSHAGDSVGHAAVVSGAGSVSCDPLQEAVGEFLTGSIGGIGRIEECGTHAELMQKQGFYYKLYASQFH